MENEQLLAQVRAEGMEALKTYYKAYRAEFLGFGRRYGLPDDDLLDIYQDAYVLTYENIVQGKLERLTSSLKTYLFAVGKNLIRTRLRQLHRAREIEVETLEIDIPHDFLSETEPTHQQEKLQVVLDQLGVKCKEILSLFYYQQFSIEAIKYRMNYESENVVKASKARCMKRLRALFDKKNV